LRLIMVLQADHHSPIISWHRKYPGNPNMRVIRLVMAGTALAALTLAPMAATADDRSDVEAAIGKWVDAFNRKSTRDIVALYAADAVLFGTSSPLLRDRPQLVQEYFSTLPSLGDAAITVGEHRVQVFGSLAINSGFYTRSATQNGTTVSNPARFTFVYEKRGGEWLIVNHHSSALPTPTP
jgi:uncharacterized protein (TIGR02246 family)